MGLRDAGHRPGPLVLPGSGTELATACDLVYVAEEASIGFPRCIYSVRDGRGYGRWIGYDFLALLLMIRIFYICHATCGGVIAVA